MNFLIIFFSFLVISCAKVSYISEQAAGQMAIEWNGVDNKKVLMDPDLKEEYKEKIRKIENYKEYFYNYFQKEETPIYSETTMLKSEAVTYLVIASSKTEINPVMHSFPLAGEFPYLGFFKKKSAKQYAKQLEEKGFATYVRPVYAYSTLNKLPFYDNILSSFFIYSDQDLAELIFHELTHTVFFAKDEVDFNESFAEYIGRELSYLYFKYDKKQLDKAQRVKLRRRKLMEFVVSKTNKLSKLYKKESKLSKTKAQKILDSFLKTHFLPEAKRICHQLEIKKCWPLKSSWNNAKFAAFMTYSKDQKIISKIHQAKKIDLKDFLKYIEKSYEDFKDSNEESFIKFLTDKEQI